VLVATSSSKLSFRLVVAKVSALAEGGSPHPVFFPPPDAGLRPSVDKFSRLRSPREKVARPGPRVSVFLTIGGTRSPRPLSFFTQGKHIESFFSVKGLTWSFPVREDKDASIYYAHPARCSVIVLRYLLFYDASFEKPVPPVGDVTSSESSRAPVR